MPFRQSVRPGRPSRYLIEVGSVGCTPKDNQKVCNEFIDVHDVFLDAGHTAAGGVHVAMTMGATVGPSVFVTGFNQAGVKVDQGHETMVLDSWIAEYVLPPGARSMLLDALAKHGQYPRSCQPRLALFPRTISALARRTTCA